MTANVTKKTTLTALIAIVILCLIPMTTAAQSPSAPPQGKERFNKERFIKEQEAYITAQAHLTSKEAAAFFPVFREMQQKQRELFMRHGKLSRTKPQDNNQAKRLIKDMDNLEVQIKQLQAKYHSKFYNVLPALKVLDCIKAEERFKHETMEKMARRHGKNGGNRGEKNGGKKFNKPHGDKK
jgi:Spy/CpxP family protein refolding chaperone